MPHVPQGDHFGHPRALHGLSPVGWWWLLGTCFGGLNLLIFLDERILPGTWQEHVPRFLNLGDIWLWPLRDGCQMLL